MFGVYILSINQLHMYIYYSTRNGHETSTYAKCAHRQCTSWAVDNVVTRVVLQ